MNDHFQKLRVLALTAVLVWGGAIAQAQTVSQFTLPAQPLADALRAVGRVANVNVLYDPPMVAGYQAPALSATMSTNEALAKLLAGTGLTHRFVNEHTVVLSAEKDPRAVSSPVSSVEGAAQSGALRLAQANSASAQAANSASAQSENKNEELEEIVVTAQKRTERLIDVPQSVSVLSADTLGKIGATQFRDFANMVPGLNYTTFGAGYNQISLRGVTSGLEVSPTVGIYVDDVPYGSTTALASSAQLALDVGLFDVDRIEVLRGPQGTLYGASSMGGLIKYVTKEPDATQLALETRTGLASTADGDLGYNGAVVANVPLAADTAALRASGFYSHDGGYVDNVTLGKSDVNRANIYGGRLDFLFSPSEKLSVRLTGMLQEIDRNGTGFVDYTFAGVPVTDVAQARVMQEPFDQRFRLGAGTLTYDLGSMKLTSITSYQTAESSLFADLSIVYVGYLALPPPNGFGRSYSAVGVPNLSTTDKFTQEVRLISQGSGPFEWIVGAFYTDEKSDYRQEFVLRDPAGQPAVNDLYTSALPSRYEEYATFGDLTWHATEKFDVTGGLRYAKNRQRSDLDQVGIMFGSADLTNRSSEDVSTYLANARYRFSDRGMVYVRYATGYRPGGPNQVGFDPITGVALAQPTFDSDRLKSYEAGIKAETGDRRFGIELAGYFIDWNNIQLYVQRGSFAVRVNAPGGAEVRGAELTLSARPNSALSITSALAYQDAQLSEADIDIRGAKGERLPNVPRLTATLNGDYQFSVGDLPLTAGATLRYVDDRTSSFNASFTPQYRLPSYTTVDVHTGFKFGMADLQIYARNLLDKRGQLSAYTSYGVPYVAITQPRTIGISVTTGF